VPTRLNIGCRRSPTPDWINYDNWPSVWLARCPMLAALGARLGLMDRHALAFVAFCPSQNIRHADAGHRIPHADGTVDAIYAPHMLEHLGRAEARSFPGRVPARAEAGRYPAAGRAGFAQRRLPAAAAASPTFVADQARAGSCTIGKFPRTRQAVDDLVTRHGSLDSP
jgi:hypothetical protein